MLLRSALVLLVCCGVGGELGAQEGNSSTPPVRMAHLRDTVALRELEESHRGGARAEDALAAGFAALQLWEVTGRKEHAARSRRYFDRAVSREPANAWAHYGNALSYEPDIEVRPGLLATDDAIGRALGINAVSKARRALERAVALDPALPGAADLLARYATATWDPAAFELARTTLRAAATRADAESEVLLALARTERENGDYGAAAGAAERVAARGDSLEAEAQLELAMALASLPDRSVDAAAAWDRSVEAADSVLLARLWEDASLIATEVDDALWRAARTPVMQRKVLRDFWGVRGALAVTGAGERASEHYRRINHAWRNHRRWGQLGAAPYNALRWQRVDPRFTDAGIIYIRHGQPDHVWGERRDYVIWYYAGEQGEPLSYHFAMLGGSGYSKDLVLIRRLPCLSPDAALHDPRLRPLTYGCNGMRKEAVSATISRQAERALRTDTDLPDFDRELAFVFDLYTFRGPAGETDVVAAIGVPRGNLAPGLQALRFSLAVVDTARYLTARSDGHAAIPSAARAGDLIHAHVAVRTEPARAAAYRVDVRMADASAGRTYGGTLEVPAYAHGPAISDIVLAQPEAEGGFIRGPHRLALVPAQVFPGGRFRVFYELYDIPAGAEYRTDIRIEPAERGAAARLLGRGEKLGIHFEEVAPEPGEATLHQLRDVTAPLEPGVYRLRVRITSPAWSGPVEQERRFTVPKR